MKLSSSSSFLIKRSAWLVLLLVFLLIPQASLASTLAIKEGETTTNPQRDEVQPRVILTISSITKAKSSNELSVALNLHNAEAFAVEGITVNARLAFTDSKSFKTPTEVLALESNYHDLVRLGAGENVKITQQITPPSTIPTGSYRLYYRIFDKSGIPLVSGTKDIDEPLTGSGQLFSLNTTESYILNSEGNVVNPLSGPNYPAGKAVTVGFTIHNPGEALKAIPVIKIYSRSATAGKAPFLEYKEKEAEVWAKGAGSYQLSLQPISVPESYLVKLSFISVDEKTVLSGEQDFRFVVKGANGKILMVKPTATIGLFGKQSINFESYLVGSSDKETAFSGSLRIVGSEITSSPKADIQIDPPKSSSTLSNFYKYDTLVHPSTTLFSEKPYTATLELVEADGKIVDTASVKIEPVRTYPLYVSFLVLAFLIIFLILLFLSFRLLQHHRNPHITSRALSVLLVAVLLHALFFSFSSHSVLAAPGAYNEGCVNKKSCATAPPTYGGTTFTRTATQDMCGESQPKMVTYTTATTSAIDYSCVNAVEIGLNTPNLATPPAVYADTGVVNIGNIHGPYQVMSIISSGGGISSTATATLLVTGNGSGEINTNIDGNKVAKVTCTNASFDSGGCTSAFTIRVNSSTGDGCYDCQDTQTLNEEQKCAAVNGGVPAGNNPNSVDGVGNAQPAGGAPNVLNSGAAGGGYQKP